MTDAIQTKEPGWSQKEVQQLLTLYEVGFSASRIAAAMGTGRSRNAVIGKLHRMGKIRKPSLPLGEVRERPRPVKPPRQQPSMPAIKNPTTAKARALQAAKHKPAQPEPLFKNGGVITIETLERGMCKFPIGNPQDPDFHFCGNPQHNGAPYCEFHCGVAFNKRGMTTLAAHKPTFTAAFFKATAR